MQVTACTFITVRKASCQYWLGKVYLQPLVVQSITGLNLLLMATSATANAATALFPSVPTGEILNLGVYNSPTTLRTHFELFNFLRDFFVVVVVQLVYLQQGS